MLGCNSSGVCFQVHVSYEKQTTTVHMAVVRVCELEKISDQGCFLQACLLPERRWGLLRSKDGSLRLTITSFLLVNFSPGNIMHFWQASQLCFQRSLWNSQVWEFFMLFLLSKEIVHLLRSNSWTVTKYICIFFVVIYSSLSGAFWWWDKHTLPTWGPGFSLCLGHQVCVRVCVCVCVCVSKINPCVSKHSVRVHFSVQQRRQQYFTQGFHGARRRSSVQQTL